MRTLTANNYPKALQQLQALDELSAKKLTGQIHESNRKHYNIIMVRKINDEVRQRYLTTFVIQAFNIRQWEKLQKNYTTMGYHSVIVLHDPSQPNASEPKAPADAGPNTTREMPTPAPEAVSEAFDVDKARVAELREFAEDNGIEIADEDLKADIKAKVKAWQAENDN